MSYELSNIRELLEGNKIMMESIKKDIEEIKHTLNILHVTSQKLDVHIDFVNNTYNGLKPVLDFVISKFNIFRISNFSIPFLKYT